MRSLLLRVLTALLVALLLAQGAISFGLHRADGNRMRPLHDALLHDKAELAIAHLEALPPDERRRSAHDLSRALRMHIEIAPPGPPPADAHVLRDGTALRIRPDGPPGPPWTVLALQAALTVVLMGGVLALLGLTLGRDLARLETASARIAAGDLSARVGLAGGAVKPVGDHFDAMAEHIQTLVIGQRNLLQAVSHELRTPHARMRFQLEALRDAPAANQESLIVGLEEDLTQVDALLEELLTSLRLTSPPTRPAEPELTAATIEAVVTRIALLHPSHALSSDVRGQCPCTARDLQRIVENLITNAQRHARSRIRVAVDPDGTLTVDDDGPGVRREDRKRIFESFHSGDPSRSRELGGVGLGLAIVKRAAERWGGSVEAGDSPLGGARFTIRW